MNGGRRRRRSRVQARTKTVTFRRRTLNRKCSEGALIVRPPVGGLDADYMGPGLYGPPRKRP